MVIGICHLCGHQASLSNSHAFPEFFYEGTYDEEHRFISVTSHPLHRPRPMQKGLREHLLCAVCEAKLSKHETYAASLLREVDQKPETPSGRVVIEAPNLESLRLFGLSLLWRAHIARGYMFRDVKLGPHALRIREMLMHEDPQDPHVYPFTFAKIVGLDTHGQMIIAPRKTRYNGHVVYHFMARGFEWVFMVATVSHVIREFFPYVGSERSLVIATISEDKQQLFARVRKSFPKALQRNRDHDARVV